MRKILIPAVATAFVVCVMVFQAQTVEPVLCDAPGVELAEIAGFASEPVEVSEAEQRVLPKDTAIAKRRYEDADGNSVSVSAVTSGKQRQSIHRPEMCLPAQGFQMTSPRTVDVGGVDWRVVALTRKDAPPMSFAYTFFNQDGFRTSSHFHRIFRDVWDRSIHGRVNRWVMVTVFSSNPDDGWLFGFLDKLKGTVIR